MTDNIRIVATDLSAEDRRNVCCSMIAKFWQDTKNGIKFIATVAVLFGVPGVVAASLDANYALALGYTAWLLGTMFLIYFSAGPVRRHYPNRNPCSDFEFKFPALMLGMFSINGVVAPLVFFLAFPEDAWTNHSVLWGLIVLDFLGILGMVLLILAIGGAIAYCKKLHAGAVSSVIEVKMGATRNENATIEVRPPNSNASIAEESAPAAAPAATQELVTVPVVPVQTVPSAAPTAPPGAEGGENA